MLKKIGYVLICVSILIITYILYTNSQYKTKTREFSRYTLLASSWDMYKKQFINTDGRVLDATQKNVTTSEGQSYALLRSVWSDDKPEFDKVWTWTNQSLKRKNDNLFGWRWGQRSDKTYGFMENGGDNAAADADSDIALALIFASSRWHDQRYLDDAKKILPDIWSTETATASGKRYLIAGNWANSKTELIVNPSYFAPYAWRIFATVDTKHDWKSLITPAYTLLTDAGQVPLDTKSGVGLPPDWIVIDKQTGAFRAPQNLGNFTTNYSYDALRIPWRVTLDAQWNNSREAINYLKEVCKPLEDSYAQDKKIVATYAHDGERLTTNESPAMYAGSLGCFMIHNPTLASEIYQNKIVRLYSNSTNTFRSDVTYYDQNWLWFGAALYNNYLVAFKPIK